MNESILHARTGQRASLALPVAISLLFVALTAASAQVRIPVPGSSVPMTLQTFVVLLAGMTLGVRWGTASMALYLAIGLVGVPVFSSMRGGWEVVVGSTGGYLVGFVLAQPIVARLTRRRAGEGTPRSRGLAGVALATLAGQAVIYAVGVPWLWLAAQASGAPMTWGNAIWFGLVVFLPGLAIKSALVLALGPSCVRWGCARGW